VDLWSESGFQALNTRKENVNQEDPEGEKIILE
jgi:hypothetical protein